MYLQSRLEGTVTHLKGVVGGCLETLEYVLGLSVAEVHFLQELPNHAYYNNKPALTSNQMLVNVIDQRGRHKSY